MTVKINKGKRRVAKLKPYTYQTNTADFNSGLRVRSSFDRIVNSLITPVDIVRNDR